ncbi:phosphatidylcholine and lysophosphatidylcholine phospholipase [Rhodotorula toruloides]|uniref:Lysophospholipase NTE1 n=1 Tax=Rhodotorula toruloides (strain NP11) TaxID=1130832 RepID=M7WP06_RHOT1|nr:lysophospholipid hydrolase [Rhodotorula toruloides NP11]EMS22247.1 lysophospholipid hydrolase [Rhodotorula toruloides NP11]
MDGTAPAPPSLANDLRTLFDLISRLSYFLAHTAVHFTARAIAFLTLTLPASTFSLIHYSASLTFHLTFLKLLAFFLLVSTVASYVWKVRYLNRYTELRDLPGGNRIKGNEGFDLHPDLATDQASSGFHNYLDEFLSAIKVFGYLEKPVFHELARHLQTRRLVAGDTLDLSRDKSFYIVVDGRVEVYARNPSAQHGDEAATEGYETEEEDEEGKEWQLLNCVESGGTLSSLFTILSLFTEDVKMRYEEEQVRTEESSDEGGPSPARERDADVSAFDLEGGSASGAGRPVRPHFPGYNSTNTARLGEETEDADDEGAAATAAGEESESTLAMSGAEVEEDRGRLDHLDVSIAPSDSRSNATTPSLARSPALGATTGFFSPPLTSPTSPSVGSAGSRKSSLGRRPAGLSFTSAASSSRPRATSRPNAPTHLNSSASGSRIRPPQKPHAHHQHHHHHAHAKRRQSTGPASMAKEATIARAATDTTLAVIPAEAFRRLTKKFPNAAAHIVQVILTRLQRVTFLTAHKYLGLTREVVRTEQAINDLACYPLPPAFWESGGIQRLRARFVPETKLDGPGEEEGNGDWEQREDYFGSRRDVLSMKGDAKGGHQGHRAGAMARRLNMPLETPYAGPRMGGVFWDSSNDEHSSDNAVRLKYRQPGSSFTTSPKSRMRTLGPAPPGAKSAALSRKAGDLLTMSTVSEDMRGAGSTVIQTPRLERLNTSNLYDNSERDFDLRDAVMECISKAIGLVQPHVTPSHSVDASPMVRPHEHHNGKSLRDQAVFNSSFGSLSFLGLQGLHDDESSTSSGFSALREENGRDAGAVGSFASMDLENEVEILYFPTGSVLVKEGEKNAGLYFVIEGFLDVSMPEAESAQAARGQMPRRTSHDDDDPPLKGPAVGRHGSKTGSTTRPKMSSARSSFREGVGATGPTTVRKPVPSTAASGSAPPPQQPKTKSIHLFTVRPGGIAGYLSSLSGFPSYVDIKAKTECYVGFLPAKSLERIMDRKPIVLLTLAKRLISLLSPLVLHIDSALDWMHVSAGQVIYRENDPADSFYIVINGRLRSITERQGGGVQVNGEFGQGESVGELDCITASPRPSTLHAIRDTELARMPMTLFNAISVRHPLVTIQISRIIAARLRTQVAREAKMAGGLPKELGMPGMGDGSMGKNNFNLKTVAILPTNRHVPVSEFAAKLHQALETIGAPTSYLNQATVMQVLGRHAFSKMGQLKLAGWLAETEQKYRIVLYVADTAVSAPWTQTCIRQADCILVVADGGADPELGEHEKLLVSMKTTARKELVLLHAERNVVPGTTRPWLKSRPWVHAHHHVEMLGATPEVNRSELHDPAAVVALRKIAARVELQISKYKKTQPRPAPQRAPALNDFARLARRLCGKSIGLVLGGGGARGISHIGVLRALHDRNIPVDMVGGTSIGAFVGGLYAREGDLVSTYGRAKRFSGRMSTLWRILTDLTYPVVAYTTGHEFNRGIYKSFYGTHIEDMRVAWLPFFCNTTNITHSRMDVHTSGYAWRYVRASMSLAGLLPPLCDEGDMLVDGGYVDNLPVSVMLEQGAASVFAVDVGSVDDTSPRNYGDTISGWLLLLQRWNPFGKPVNIPNITEIQSRLTYVSSVKMLEEAKATPGVLYMRMPVTQFGTMDFKRFGEILDVGSEFANSLLDEWATKGELPSGTEGDVAVSKKQRRGQAIRRNSI